MKQSICVRIFFFSIVIFSAGYSFNPQTETKKTPQQCPMNPDYLDPARSRSGLLPPPMDLSHLEREAKAATVFADLPSAWDWRNHNGVTPAKNQSSCNVCWAFASTGILESLVLIDSGQTYDFSEQNVKECNDWLRGCNGGTAFTATSYFTRHGTVLETCDPYVPDTTGTCNSSCSKIIQVTGWKLLGNDITAIKNAIYNYGPVNTSMYSGFPGFVNYDGSYVMYYPGTEGTDHAVMIIGWDDSMLHDGGTGAWICKNSWGTGWGDNGFFYIAYGSAKIGSMSNHYDSYKEHDASEILYHYDEGGWIDSYGFPPSTTAWGLVKFTPTQDGYIHAVDLWQVVYNLNYTIYIYDDFNGSEVSNLLNSQSGTLSMSPGYNSIPLDSPVQVSKSDDFVVVVKYGTSYEYPVTADSTDTYYPIETGKCYISPDGSPGSWVDMGVNYNRDICIRARTSTQTTEPPAAPSNVSAAATACDQINLSWVDNSTNEDGFKIERSEDGVSFTQIAINGANENTYTETGLSENTAYWYRIRAYNQSGTSDYSNVDNDTTPLCSTPAVCGNVAVVLTPPTATYDEEIEVSINISNNQCEMIYLGFDLLYETSLFSFLGVETQNCLTADWSTLDGYEVSPGHLRIGGYAGSGTTIQPNQNGSLVRIRLRVNCPCNVCTDGQQSTIRIDSYIDDLESYLPQPAQGVFTLECCGGDISLPTDMAGVWGSLIHIPVNVANNYDQICDFEFDFVFDPTMLEFRGLIKSAAIQDWTTLTWSPVVAGKIRVSGSVGLGTCIPALSNAVLVKLQVMVRCVGYPSDTYTPIKIEFYKNGIASLCPRAFEVDFLYKACPRLGDVNGDGIVTAGDAQKAFEIYLGTRTPTFAQLTTADANCGCPCDGMEHSEENNCITPGDAQWIFEHYLSKRILPMCAAEYTCPEISSSIISRVFNPHFKEQRVFPLPATYKPGEQAKIPVMINNPEGIRNFGLDLVYPHEVLEYTGLLASPLTHKYMRVRSEELVPGIVTIEGFGEEGIPTKEAGSLCVAVFHVREGISGDVPIELFNLNGDISGAETGRGIVRIEHFPTLNKSLNLGEGREKDKMLIVPVLVTNACDLKAFGLELKFPADKLNLLGVKRTPLTRDFISVDWNQIEAEVARVGGFGLSGIQDFYNGILLNLIFEVKEPGGEVEIVKVDDDLKNFMIVK